MVKILIMSFLCEHPNKQRERDKHAERAQHTIRKSFHNVVQLFLRYVQKPDFRSNENRTGWFRTLCSKYDGHLILLNYGTKTNPDRSEFSVFGFWHFSNRALWENGLSQKLPDSLNRSGAKFQGLGSPEGEKTQIFPAVFEIWAKNEKNPDFIRMKVGFAIQNPIVLNWNRFEKYHVTRAFCETKQ